MPPKKKAKPRKKARKKDDGQLELEGRYRKTLREIESLKDHLAFKKELVRRSKDESTEWKQQVLKTQQSIEMEKATQQGVSADMTRQYKIMQTELGVRIFQLETELSHTRKVLNATQANLRATIEEKEKISKTKNAEIESLMVKIDNMEKGYEGLLHNAFDNLVLKLDSARKNWEDRTRVIQAKNKQTILEFGLNPLDI